jgi:hypothetical protein
MTPVFIPNRFARSDVIERAYVDEPGLSVYRSSPYCVVLQVRTRTPKQGRISLVCLTREDCELLAERLTQAAAELEIEEAAR